MVVMELNGLSSLRSKKYNRIMITLERLHEVFESKNSFFWKEEGKHIFLLISKYPHTNFQITVVSKLNENHIKEFYGSLGPFDAFDLIRELLSPLNDKL